MFKQSREIYEKKGNHKRIKTKTKTKTRKKVDTKSHESHMT